ncbi:MAG: hypothetical protein ACYDC6_08245 [Acidobacteriaceae bacterium]
MPYIYIDKVLNELREELLSAMHAAVERELRHGKVDVSKLYRAFTRAAAGQCSNPVRVSDKCLQTTAGKVQKPRAGPSGAQ